MMPDGSLDVLTASDIVVSPGAAELVALSGCSSAGRELEPGAGIAGLTRAWIAAGARTVIATLWPTTDSGGAFFRTFYERLGAGDSPGEALRTAQVTCIHSSLPCARDWAAYVVVGD
jgi:CHAT domain-containing protein